MDFPPVWVSSPDCDLEATLKERKVFALFLTSQALRTFHRVCLPCMHMDLLCSEEDRVIGSFGSPLQGCCPFKVTPRSLLMPRFESAQGHAILGSVV